MHLVIRKLQVAKIWPLTQLWLLPAVVLIIPNNKQSLAFFFTHTHSTNKISLADFSKTPDLLVSRPGFHKQAISIIISKVSARKQECSFQINCLTACFLRRKANIFLVIQLLSYCLCIAENVSEEKPSCPNHLLVCLGNKITALHPAALEITVDANVEWQLRRACFHRMLALTGKPVHRTTDPNTLFLPAQLSSSPPTAASVSSWRQHHLGDLGEEWSSKGRGDGGVSSMGFFV